MLTAFLHKISKIINIIIGTLITLVLTYLVYSFTQDFSSTIFILLVGLTSTVVIATIGEILCLLEGFTLSALGFLGFFAAGNPSAMFSSGTLITAVVASIFTTGIATFIGDKLFSARTFTRGLPKGKPRLPARSYGRQTLHESSTSQPIEVTILPETESASIDGAIAPPKVVHNPDELLKRKRAVRQQMNSLQIEKTGGKISEETATKLQEELEHELKNLDQNLVASQVQIEELLNAFKLELPNLRYEKSMKLKHQEELEARYRIKQMDKKEYREKLKANKNAIKSIDQRIAEKQKRIKTFERQLYLISQSLTTKDS